MYIGKVGERERKVNKPMEWKINLAKKKGRKKEAVFIQWLFFYVVK